MFYLALPCFVSKETKRYKRHFCILLLCPSDGPRSSGTMDGTLQLRGPDMCCSLLNILVGECWGLPGDFQTVVKGLSRNVLFTQWSPLSDCAKLSWSVNVPVESNGGEAEIPLWVSLLPPSRPWCSRTLVSQQFVQLKNSAQAFCYSS